MTNIQRVWLGFAGGSLWGLIMGWCVGYLMGRDSDKWRLR